MLDHLAHLDLQDAQETQGKDPLDRRVLQVHKAMEDQDPKETREMLVIRPALGTITLHNQDHQDHPDLLGRRDHKGLKGIKVNQDSPDSQEPPGDQEAQRECQRMEEDIPFKDPLVRQDLLDLRDHRELKETAVLLASLAPHEATSLSALGLLGLQVLLGLQAGRAPRLHPLRCTSTSMTI